jgi:hypothetical protein
VNKAAPRRNPAIARLRCASIRERISRVRTEATVLARLLYIPVMLVGGLHFCLFGTVLGTMLFMTLFEIAEGKPTMALRTFASDGAIEMFFLGTIYGGPPAFVTGLVAGPLRLHIGSRLLFAALMAPASSSWPARLRPLSNF